MAKVTLKHPVDSITGAIIKGGIIYRKKNYKDLNGKNIAQGAKEVYLIRQPRNYKTNPTTIAEKKQQNLWKQTCYITQQILKTPTTAQLWNEKFQAQLTIPDKLSPIDPKTNKPKQYHRIDNYIRANIYRQLKYNTDPNLLQYTLDMFQ